MPKPNGMCTGRNRKQRDPLAANDQLNDWTGHRGCDKGCVLPLPKPNNGGMPHIYQARAHTSACTAVCAGEGVCTVLWQTLLFFALL